MLGNAKLKQDNNLLYRMDWFVIMFKVPNISWGGRMGLFIRIFFSYIHTLYPHLFGTMYIVTVQLINTILNLYSLCKHVVS